MSGKRVLAVYAALLLGFAVVLCRLYLLALHPTYAARAAAQSTVTLQLPARRGNFYDAQGRLLTGLEERWQVVCFPGQGNYDRLYACTDAAGQALLYRSRSRAAPFLLEVSCDPARLGMTGYPAARRYAAVPLCQHLLGYLDGTGHGAAGLEKALDGVLSGTGEHSSLICAVTAQGTLRTGETARLLQADSGALGVQLTISRPVQRAAEAVAANTMTSGCILVLDTATAAVRASVSVPGYDPEHLADSLQAENSPFLNRALQCYAVGSVFKPVLAAVSARLPECCLCPCEPGAEGGISPQSIPRILRQKATVLLIGPGLGYLAQSTARAAETRTLVKKLLTGFSGSAVLDADGLNAAASLMNAGEELPRPAKELILTPHPGEMSRLTGLSVEAVQADREGVARRYAAQWNAVVVLKGARTVVAAPDGRVCVNPTGNPGLARGGSGDVLAGMTSALLACGLSAYEAAACAVWLHGAAADRAARQKGEYGMLPQDIFAHLGQMFAENDR